jgi:hypothetical protein
VSCNNAFSFTGNNTFHVWVVTSAASHSPVVSPTNNECFLQRLPHAESSMVPVEEPSTTTTATTEEKHGTVKEDNDSSPTLLRFLKQQVIAGKKQAASKRRATRNKREFNKCRLRQHTAIARQSWSDNFQQHHLQEQQRQEQQEKEERQREEQEDFFFNGLDNFDCDALAFFGDCDRMNLDMDDQVASSSSSSVDTLPVWATAPWNWAVLTPPASMPTTCSSLSSANNMVPNENNNNNNDNDNEAFYKSVRSRHELLLAQGFGYDTVQWGHNGLGLP